MSCRAQPHGDDLQVEMFGCPNLLRLLTLLSVAPFVLLKMIHKEADR